MALPEKNYFFENLPSNCDVEERQCGRNSAFVATVNGVEGVVSWSGQDALKAHETLARMTLATLKRKRKAEVK